MTERKDSVDVCSICGVEHFKWFLCTLSDKGVTTGPFCLECIPTTPEPKTDRPSWHQYFMKLAQTVSERATCDRAKVGCVIVKNKQILSTGYNGSAPGEPHCNMVGHLMIDDHCRRTVHGEHNALLQAAKHGISVDGAVAYITHFPCWGCYLALVTAGIEHIYYATKYRVDTRYPYNYTFLTEVKND